MTSGPMPGGTRAAMPEAGVKGASRMMPATGRRAANQAVQTLPMGARAGLDFGFQVWCGVEWREGFG